MSMKFSHLVTHWEPHEALSIIEFLDELRDLIYRSYGEEIDRFQREEHVCHTLTEEQFDLDFEDSIQF